MVHLWHTSTFVSRCISSSQNVAHKEYLPYWHCYDDSLSITTLHYTLESGQIYGYMPSFSCRSEASLPPSYMKKCTFIRPHSGAAHGLHIFRYVVCNITLVVDVTEARGLKTFVIWLFIPLMFDFYGGSFIYFLKLN